MLASVTELNLKNFWCFLRFLPHAVKSQMQAKRAPGVVSVKVGSKGFLVQRTLTVWQDEQAMKTYYRSGAHLQAMRVFPTIANVSYTAHYEVSVPPSWKEALRYLQEHGRAHGSGVHNEPTKASATTP